MATKNLFDLRTPDYDDPHWLAAFRLVLNSVSNARAGEIAKIGMTTAMASLVNLLIESVRYPPVGDNANAEDKKFTTRRSAVCDDFNRGVNQYRIAFGCEPAAVQEKDTTRQTADRAFQMWENMFGKRGDPATERKIEQTAGILMHKIEQAEEAAKGKKRTTVREAKQRQRKRKGR